MDKFKHIKKTNYVVITGDMITDLGLKGNELLVYALINGFCQDEESQFYGSLAYLMEFTSLSKQGVINTLNSLVKNGLIEKTQSEVNGVKFNSYRAIGGMSNNLTTGKNNDDAKKEKESFKNSTDRTSWHSCSVSSGNIRSSGLLLSGSILQRNNH